MQNTSFSEKTPLLLIVNPMAGQRKAQSTLFAVVEQLSKKYSVTVHITESGDDARETAKKAREIFDHIFCCGGDGTLSEVVSGCADTENPPFIGYVPCGTANDVASTLGLPKNMRRCAEKIVSAEPHFHDVGIFNGQKYIYTASFGAFSKISYSTPQAIKNVLGQSAYMISGISDLGSIRKYPTVVICDGERHEFDDATLLSVCNTKSTGGLVKFRDGDVSLNDGLFELLLIRYPSNINTLNSILDSIIKKKYTENDSIVLLHGRKFEIETAEPIEWTLDGEDAGTHTKVSVECIHNAIRLFY